ncbi:hypothetical protein ACXYUI_30990, partial [Klebsiella pneumoniae]
NYRHLRVVCQSSTGPGFCISPSYIGNEYTLGFADGGGTADSFLPTPAGSTYVGALAGLGVDPAGNLITADQDFKRIRILCLN